MPLGSIVNKLPTKQLKVAKQIIELLNCVTSPSEMNLRLQKNQFGMTKARPADNHQGCSQCLLLTLEHERQTRRPLDA